MPSIADPMIDLTPKLNAWTKKALNYHKEGSNAQATNVFKRILMSAPGHTDSWHLLGLLRHKQGYSTFGAACIEVAIQQAPNMLFYRGNAIEVYRKSGQLDKAVHHATTYLDQWSDMVRSKSPNGSGDVELLSDSTATSLESLPMETFRALLDHLSREGQEQVCIDFFLKYELTLLFQVVRVGSGSSGSSGSSSSSSSGSSSSNSKLRTTKTKQQSEAASEVLASAALCAFGQVTNSNKSTATASNNGINGINYINLAIQYFELSVQITPSYSNGWMQLATLRDHKNQFDLSLQIYRRAFHTRWLERYNPTLGLRLGIEMARNTARQRKQRVVVLYCDEYGQTWWPNWGPSSMDNGGAGGSEEAVIFISAELVKLGYHVEVYGEPLELEWGLHSTTGVWWLPLQSYDESNFLHDNERGVPTAALHSVPAPDIFVAWRYHISMFAGDAKQSQRYLWLQDISSRFIQQYTNTFLSSLDGLFVLSHFHALNGLPKAAVPITTITPNGLEASYFVNGPNHNHKFMYASAPNRGLRQVLLAWPSIRKHIPHAVLTVYYGFSTSFVKYGRSTMPNFDTWYNEMQTMLQQPGVVYVGMVDHTTLAQAYAEHGFYLYPTSFPETGCVALMKALALGAIPITSRHPHSTLPELTTEWDLGPVGRATGDIASDSVWFDAWVTSVIEAATMEKGKIEQHRKSMMLHR